ncbi:MAG: hypothetical protein JW951_08295, partial [Lentisphaerae bacterium]|nr:hypothetical protein [Lentisphaerota bacterium]
MKTSFLLPAALAAALCTGAAAGAPERASRHPAAVRTPAAAEAVAVWSEERDGNCDIFCARRTGGAWEAARALSCDPHRDFRPAVDQGPDGTLWAVWTRASRGRRLLYACRFDGRRWTDPERLPAGSTWAMAPSVHITAQGGVWIAWAGHRGGDDDIFYTRRSAAGWTEPRRVHAENAAPDVLPCLLPGPGGQPALRWTRHAGGCRYESVIAHWDGRRWTEPRAVPDARAGDAERRTIRRLCAAAPFRRRSLDPMLCYGNGSGRRAVRLSDLRTSAPPADAPRAAREALLILGFGDSITQGYPYLKEPG